jgi:DNA-binding NarL/FixJ family response regulator
MLNQGPPTTVVVADDHELVRRGLRGVLEEAGLRVVGEAADGQAAVERAIELRPDVLLLDLRMPVLDGVEVCRRVHAEAPGVRIVVLTSFAEDEDIFGAISAGAAGYVMKDIAPDVLVGTIRGVAEGQTVLDPVIAQRVIDRGNGRVAVTPDLLSPREMGVLGLMAEGLTNRQIATRLWISEATVKSHVSHILAKLGRTDRTQAIVFAMRAGLVRSPSDDGANPRREE